MKSKSQWSLVGKDPYALQLDEIDLSHPGIWQANEYLPFLKRLRDEDPVHYCRESAVGPYWSVMKYKDIMHVDTSPQLFSSEPTIGIVDTLEEFTFPAFISMDPPKHDEQRRVVQGVVAPANLKNLESVIRQRAGGILDSLPIGEEFDWVNSVSIELTTQMLATLFDFPFEDRHKLTHWSDVATAIPGNGVIESQEQRWEAMEECLAYFTGLWNERINKEPGNDLISMLAHGKATKNMPPMEYLGNIILLIVGGNDTTRNSISGGVLALSQNPDQYQKLREDASLIPNMVSEIIRWQTPLAYMRRTAIQDTDLGGKAIKVGDKVIMWYASGNLDEEVIDRPGEFLIDRANARHHLSFGFGLHRCMGNRLAEMQLRIVWEEIMKRFHQVEVVGEPERIYSSFVKGYSKLPVVLHPLS
ncbi:MAG TPA: cytochrome P450 [Porticoccaceae bacterium]|nr:cytochrome P450 [Gammaproteobacteria bacterium]HIL59211.1 cytochrome P450 [Porticoccaceae bacterium]